MTWIDRILGRGARRRDAPSRAERAHDEAPSVLGGATSPGLSASLAGKPLSYDPGLLPRLVDDHEALIHLFEAVRQHALKGDWVAARKSLLAFRSRLTDHLLVENTRLYVHLRRSLETTDLDSVSLARSFQQEMNQIARTVISFINKYADGDGPGLPHPGFLAELGEIGDALHSRIAREESTLYPLYGP
jgi:hypothetical protein